MAEPRRPAFQLYPAEDVLLDPACRRMSLEALGAHIKLLCISWLEGGLLADPPTNPPTNPGGDRGGYPGGSARDLSIHPLKFKKLWEEVAPAWELFDDGKWYCPRLEEKRQRLDDYVAKQRTNGRKGGRPRKEEQEPEGGSATETQDEPKETQAFSPGNPNESSSSSSPSSSPTSPSEMGSARGARQAKREVPEDFAPHDRHRKKAGELGVDAEKEAEAFRDFHRSKGNRFADVDLAFFTWLRNAPRFGSGGGKGRAEPTDPDSRLAAEVEAFLEEEPV